MTINLDNKLVSIENLQSFSSPLDNLVKIQV